MMMKKQVQIRISIIFFSLLVSVGLWGQTTYVSGKVSAYNGQNLALAHVQLAPLGYGILPDDPIAFTQVEEDGSYQVTVEQPGAYMMIFTGVHHKAHFVYLFVPEAGRRQEINVQLGTHKYTDNADWLGVIGDFNDFDYTTKTALNEQPDGTYIAQLLSTNPIARMNLLGAAWGTGIAFPSDRYEWRKHHKIATGGYVGLVATDTENSTSLVFDPKVLPPAGQKAVLVFDDPKQEQLQQVFQAAKDRETHFMDALNDYRMANNLSMEGFDFDFQPFFSELEQQLEEVKDQDVRDLLFISYGWLGRLTGDSLNAAVAHQAFKTISPASVVWGIETYAVKEFIEAVGGLKENPAYIAYLEQMVAQQALRETKATMLGNLVGFYLKEDPIKYQAYYTQLTTDFADTFAARSASRRYRRAKNIEIGKLVPEYSLINTRDDKQAVTNTSMSGKLYLIDFWATWCGPCIGELPNLHEVYELYKDQNFEILSISIDEKRKAVDNFRMKDKYPMPWLSTFAGGGFDGEIADKFEVVGIPKAILVDENGKIVALDSDLRGSKLAETIGKYVKQ